MALSKEKLAHIYFPVICFTYLPDFSDFLISDFFIGKTEVEVDGLLFKRVIEVQRMESQDREHILYP